MSLKNTWLYTKTIIDWDSMKTNFGNRFMVVSSRPYSDKKGVLPDGYVLTLLVLEDSGDYGIDKSTNEPRESNKMETFEVTVLNSSQKFKKGEHISLVGFLPEHSFAIGFDLLLRFQDAQKLQNVAGKKNG